MGNLDTLRSRLLEVIDHNKSGAIDEAEFRQWYVAAVVEMERFRIQHEVEHRERQLLSSRHQVSLPHATATEAEPRGFVGHRRGRRHRCARGLLRTTRAQQGCRVE